MCHPLRPIRWALIVIAFAAFLGCQTIRSSNGLLEQQTINAGVSSKHLRIILDDLVLQFSSEVEQAADQIIAANESSRTHKNALLWKTNGIASGFQASSRRDALGSYFDLWILNKQSLALFRHPADPPLFGESQTVAIAACERIESSMTDVLNMIGDDLPIKEDFARNFASDFPIDNLYFNRASITAHYTQYIDQIEVGQRELLEVVGDLDDQLDQLQRLSSMYAEFLPKQARWNGELMVLETLQSTAVTAPLQDMSLAANGVARIADTTQSLPQLVERERNLLHDAISEERELTLFAIDRMRMETVGQMQRERIAVMTDLGGERNAVLQAIQQERIAATKDMAHFGSQALEQLDRSFDAKIITAADQGRELIDHAFTRFVQALVVLLPLSLLLFYVLRRRKADSEDVIDEAVEERIRDEESKQSSPRHLRFPHRRAA